MTVDPIALRLAGFTLVHAMWSIDGGLTLATLAFTEHDGDRELNRYVDAPIPETLDLAHADLAERLPDSAYAALAFDTYVTYDGVRTDAITVEILGAGGTRLGTVFQRYIPGSRSRLPLIGRSTPAQPIGPPIFDDDFDDAESEVAFFEGVDEHPQGSLILRP